MSNKTFAARLRSTRRSRNITQGDLAKKAGTTQASISKFEKGDQEPGLTKTLRLAEELGVTVGYLMGEDAPKGSPSSEAMAIANDWERLNADQKVMIRASMDAFLGNQQ